MQELYKTNSMQKESSVTKTLKAEYKTLSEVLEKFPKKSQHPVAKHIQNRLEEILFRIEQELLNPFIPIKTRRSKIVSSKHEKTWRNPRGEEVHYYRLDFENGDNGVVGIIEHNDPKIGVGKTIFYYLDHNKLKIINGYKKIKK